MSHLKERRENNCLNCNARVHGRFCHICGQENIEPKESVLHLVNHYFQDITHFDGKFFSTLSYLIRRPGFLTREYMNGRRASYLNPIRMYVFTSALFFLVFFIAVKSGLQDDDKKPSYSSTKLVKKINDRIAALEGMKHLAMDSAKQRRVTEKIARYREELAIVSRDSIAGKKIFDQYREESGIITFSDEDYTSLASYDSIQSKLPNAEKDNFFERRLVRKGFQVKEKYKGATGTMQERLMDNFIHKFPQILFISLPVFAMFLKLLYFRRKTFYYADHIIFSIHLYIFTFITMLVMFLFQELLDLTGWRIFNMASILLTVAILFYQYKAMRNFYQQSRWKTIVKFSLVNLLALIVMMLLFLGFFLFSFFQT